MTFLIYAALFVLSELLRPKPDLENAKPAGLGDFQFPTATEDRVIPLIWGTVKVKGPNIVWYGDFLQTPLLEHVKTGLFSSSNVIRGWKYSLGMQMALCRGEANKLLKVWIGEEEVFSGDVEHDDTFTIDCPELFGGDDIGNGGVVGTLHFFAGTPTQGVSNYLSSRSTILTAAIATAGTGYTAGDILTLVGGTFTRVAKLEVNTVNGTGVILSASVFDDGLYQVAPTNPVSVTGGTGSGATFNFSFDEALQQEGGDTPAYRRVCYIAPEEAAVYLGNSTSIKPWAFEIQRIPNGLALGSQAFVNSVDANPMNVIYELMTDTEWGLAQLAATIDVSNFQAAALTLFSEGNGFSFMLDKSMPAVELLKILQEQIDGVVFFNQIAGKWQVSLARGGYDINLLQEISPSNLHELDNFSQGAWEETTNVIRTPFNDRADQYKDASGFAQDMANIRVMQGTTIVSEVHLPGVKDTQLATDIAWRELRTLSYPLAKGTFVVDRTFYDAHPGKVYAFTYPDLGIVKMPVRVQNVDLGDLADGRVRLDVVQDVFTSQVGSFAPSPPTGWTPPTGGLQAFDTDKQLAFEAPRGFVIRDPVTDGALLHKVWAGARRKGPEVGFKIVERHHPTTPAGAFNPAGSSFQLFYIGRLTSALGVGSTVPLSTLSVTPGPDLQTTLEALFTDGAALTDLGTNLINLIMVDSEFMLPAGAQTSGANVQLNSVYRGVLDSVQQSHLAGTKVYLLFAGGNLTETELPATDLVQVKLLPMSGTDELNVADATQIAFTMANRIERPYAPSRLSLDGTAFSASTSLEANGAGPETFAIDLSIIRRDYRVTNELPQLSTDAGTLFADYPTANGTTHTVAVRNDPNGTNTLLFSDPFGAAQFDVLRLKILQATDGVLPTRLRFDIKSTHTDGGVSYDSRFSLVHDFNVTTALSGQFNFGALDTNDVSNLYTTTVAGVYNFTLSSSFASGTVEYRVNGGAFLPLITAGNTAGVTAALLVGDTIEVRHTSVSVGALKQLDMNAAGAGQDAYAILFV